MKEFRTYCQIDRKLIPDSRRLRGSRTCCNDCQKRYVKQKKLERDQRICQQCGRPWNREIVQHFRKWLDLEGIRLENCPNPKKSLLGRLDGIKKHAIVLSDPMEKVFQWMQRQPREHNAKSLAIHAAQHFKVKKPPLYVFAKELYKRRGWDRSTAEEFDNFMLGKKK